MPGRWADARQPQPQGARRDAGAVAAARRVVGEGQRRSARRRPRTTWTGRSGPAIVPLHEAYGRPSPRRPAHPGSTCPATSGTGRPVTEPSTGATAGCRCGTTPPATLVAPRAPLPGDARRRRGDRRRRLHRAVDGVLPGQGATRRCGSPSSSAEVAGFGACGRNGGWCSALFPASMGCARPQLRARRRAGAAAAPCTRPSTRSARSSAAEGIDCPLRQGRHGLARPHAGAAGAGPRRGRRRRARVGLRPRTTCGCSTPTRRERSVGATDVLRRHVHPALRGDPPGPAGPRAGPRGRRAPRRARSTSAPRCAAIEPGRVRHEHGAVRADVVVRATEGFTPPLPGHRRDRRARLLADAGDRAAAGAFWERSGSPTRETFTDQRHLIIYGQRTADDRLAFGGRGAPYHFGSRIRPEFDREPRGVRRAARDPRRAVPARSATPRSPTRGAARWASPATGTPRWGSTGDRARLGRRLRRRRRGTTNLAGRTLADLVTGPRHRPGPAALGQPPVAAAGSRSRCAGSVSPPRCGWCRPPTPRSRAPAGRPAARLCCRG